MQKMKRCGSVFFIRVIRVIRGSFFWVCRSLGGSGRGWWDSRRLGRQCSLCRRFLTGLSGRARRLESQRYLQGRDADVAGFVRREVTADNAEDADKTKNEAVPVCFSYPCYPRHPRFIFRVRGLFRSSGWGW